jgi:hypothetical protein
VGDSIGSRYEVGEVTRLSSSHVMLVLRGGKLAPEFKESDQSENLPLSIVGNSVPKSRGVGLGRETSSVHLHSPRELDSVSMDDVSTESEHSNTSVLDLSMTEESDSSLIGGSPELSLSKVERIVESYNGVKLLSESLKISLLIALMKEKGQVRIDQHKTSCFVASLKLGSSEIIPFHLQPITSSKRVKNVPCSQKPGWWSEQQREGWEW